MLIVANGVSTAARAMIFLAVPWHVLQTTGSPVRAGLAVAAELAGMAASSLLCAPILPRWGYRATVAGSGLVAAASIAAIPLWNLTFWPLLLAVLVHGIARAPEQTAMTVIAPDLPGPADVEPDQAGRIDEYVRSGALAVGSVLAGVLIEAYQAPTTMMVGAVAIAAAAVLVGGIVRHDPVELPVPVPYSLGLRSSLVMPVAGPGSSVLAIAAGAGLAVETAALNGVVLPVYAHDVLHSPLALGLIAGLFAAGIVVGSALHEFVHPVQSPRFALLLVFVNVSRLCVLALRPGLPVILVWTSVAGAAVGPTMETPTIVRYAQVSPPFRALLDGGTRGKLFAAAPVGAVLAGLAVVGIGLTATLWVIAGLMFVLITIPALAV
ncbi:MFS transporter [Actinophytocola sp.]|uniref:MFS transporter n=1 Tax=Actinophytocola sp. TaxID=1872138 RepID=UPI002ED6AD4A